MAEFFRIQEREGTLLIAVDRPPLDALTFELLEQGTALLGELALALSSLLRGPHEAIGAGSSLEFRG